MSAAGLYLHVPFCSAICPYCDFAVLTSSPARRQKFVELLSAEIGMWAGEFRHPIDTVYLGGGTPSLLEPEQLARVLGAVRRLLPVSADAWVSLEANPEDVSAQRLAAWRELGVGTVSLGVQSFDPAALAFLGRRHDAAASRRALELARSSAVPLVSVDLIYGLPGQGPEAWRRELETAVELAPDHLSCYQLTVHEGTLFGFRQRRGERIEAPEPRQAELFRLTHTLLAARGYEGYEVSNFARRPESRSRHNQKYWRHLPYLGLGPSAHSFDGARRWWNLRKLPWWETTLQAGERPVAGQEHLQPADLALEALMLGLRTRDGADLAAIETRWGVALRHRNRARIEALEAAGLVRVDGPRLLPTLEGLAVADSLAAGLEIG